MLQDLTKSQTGHAELSKAQRPSVFADVNICLTSSYSYQQRTQELQGKEITEAGKFLLQEVLCPLLSVVLSPYRSKMNN